MISESQTCFLWLYIEQLIFFLLSPLHRKSILGTKHAPFPKCTTFVTSSFFQVLVHGPFTHLVHNVLLHFSYKAAFFRMKY